MALLLSIFDRDHHLLQPSPQPLVLVGSEMDVHHAAQVGQLQLGALLAYDHVLFTDTGCDTS